MKTFFINITTIIFTIFSMVKASQAADLGYGFRIVWMAVFFISIILLIGLNSWVKKLIVKLYTNFLND